MNIWHDISPKVITKEKFTAVIEIPKGSKVKYELDKTTGLLRMDRPTILQTMVLSLGRMQRTATRWMYLCFARKRLRLCLWLTVTL